MLLRALCVLVATFFLTACDGEPADYSSAQYDISWLWVAGESTTNAPGNYGALGVPANTNRPGARSGAVSWTDADGNFWMFGGFGRDADGFPGYLNDLWKFDGAGWVWVAGSDGVNERAVFYDTQGKPVPGARELALGWADATGQALYLFGGRGYDGSTVGSTVGNLNDLWKFDIASGEWTWVGGSNLIDGAGDYGTKGTSASTNIPGSRYGAVGWVQPPVSPAATPTFWLFGGRGKDATEVGYLNDLWKLNTATGEWTWVSGANTTAGASATYGSAGIFAAANTPGGREGAVAWYDKDGKVWLFGGTGKSTTGARTVFNELWRFVELADLNGDGVLLAPDTDTANDPDDGPAWAWIGGSQDAFAVGEYGPRGVAALTNVPPGRHRPTAWLDANGTTLWMSGGAVESVSGTTTYPNDLWRYDSVAWTWVGGSQAAAGDALGDYLGLLLSGKPAGRSEAVGWADASGLWLFGGGIDSERRNDFWRFQP